MFSARLATLVLATLVLTAGVLAGHGATAQVRCMAGHYMYQVTPAGGGALNVSRDDDGAVESFYISRVDPAGSFANAQRICGDPAADDPARDLRAVREWFDIPIPEDASADSYDVTMEGNPDGYLPVRRIVRHLPPWTVTMEYTRLGERRDTYVGGGKRLLLVYGPDGAVWAIDAQSGFSLQYGPDAGMNEVTVLGERCRWTYEAGIGPQPHRDCLAADGVPLARAYEDGPVNYGPGSGVRVPPGRQRDYLGLVRAAEVSRGAVTPDDVSPPPEVFDPAYWGLPER